MNLAASVSRGFVSIVIVVLLSTFCLAQSSSSGSKGAPTAADDKDKTLATVDVEIKPITVYETFDGIFESTSMHEVKTDFETWTDLKIKKVIDEGTAVKSGQALMEFDRTSIEKAIREAEFATQNSQFDLESARLDQKEMQTTFDLDKALAERSWKDARQDYEYYQSTQLPERIDDLAYSEKSAGYFLEYSRDELDQLEQMYTEDELTEESEEIVLKRARRSVESAERSKDRTLRRVARDRETNVPREQISKEDELKRNELNFRRKMVTLPIAREKAAIALEQAEFKHVDQVKKLNDLKSDHEKMSLTAPYDGVVYYGRCARGKWVGGTGAPKRRLEAEKKVTANTVVMTIVDIGQLMVRASLNQDSMYSLSPGMRGKAKLGSSNIVFPSTVKSVSRIPLDSGSYDCQIMVENLPGNGTIMPGMSCKLSFPVYDNEQAVVAPKASVFSDDGGISHYVYIVAENKATKKSVVVGHVSGELIEIREGLSAGDRIAKTRQ